MSPDPQAEYENLAQYARDLTADELQRMTPEVRLYLLDAMYVAAHQAGCLPQEDPDDLRALTTWNQAIARYKSRSS